MCKVVIKMIFLDALREYCQLIIIHLLASSQGAEGWGLGGGEWELALSPSLPPPSSSQ